MRKKHLLFLMLLTLLVPWAANAQQVQTATFNNGTTTTTYLPIYGMYADYGCKGQFIIPATDLAAQGITPGCVLFKLQFYSNATTTASFFGTTVQIEVGEVSFSTFSNGAFVTSGLTSVISDVQTLTRKASGILEIAFRNSYTYQGGNLLISIGGYGNQSEATNWLGAYSDNSGVYNYNQSGPGSIPTSGVRTGVVPKVTISYTTETPQCQAPFNLTCTELNNTTARLNWEVAYNHDNRFQIYYDKEGDSQGFMPYVTPTANNTLLIAGLVANTTYHFYVVRHCAEYGYVYSDPSNTVTFTTGSWRPTNVVASNVTTNSAEVDWTNNATSISYNLRYGLSASSSSWVTVENVSKPYTFPHNLDPNTDYYVEVCSRLSNDVYSDWSEPALIHTTTPQTFTTAGNWNEASNWTPEGVPAENEDVVIAAAATIPANYTAVAHRVTMQSGCIVTIADGGQLKSHNGVLCRIEKAITGYGTGSGNYYLVAAPFTAVSNDFTYGATTIDDIDLYRFEESQVGAEWRNFKQIGWNTLIQRTKGYLYARKESATVLIGRASVGPNYYYPTDTDVQVNLAYTAGNPLAGWNLIGNPYTCNAYLANNRPFYRMNEAGDAIVAATNNDVIKPCEGIFVKADAVSESVTFTSTEPTLTEGGLLTMNLSQGANNQMDNAIVRFDGGMGLEKFSFREGSSKVFIPQEGKDYAVVSANPQGELPVSFKAESNGTYTISFSGDVISSEAKKSIITYLHLIDNLTGKDVNLLETPSYSFEAKTTDYANRFRLVFNGNANVEENNEQPFAYLNDGNIIVNAGPSTGSGTSTLHVFDILGRQHFANELSTINYQLSTANFPPGVYVLRLINGDSVRTQKIVIK